MQRMEAAEKRKFEEKERRLAQARAHAAAERALRKKVAAATFARSYLQGEGSACLPSSSKRTGGREVLSPIKEGSGKENSEKTEAAGGDPAAGEAISVCQRIFNKDLCIPCRPHGHLPLLCALLRWDLSPSTMHVLQASWPACGAACMTLATSLTPWGVRWRLSSCPGCARRPCLP